MQSGRIEADLLKAGLIGTFVAQYIEIDAVVKLERSLPTYVQHIVRQARQIDDNRRTRRTDVRSLHHHIGCVTLVLPCERLHRDHVFSVRFYGWCGDYVVRSLVNMLRMTGLQLTQIRQHIANDGAGLFVLHLCLNVRFVLINIDYPVAVDETVRIGWLVPFYFDRGRRHLQHGQIVWRRRNCTRCEKKTK